MGSGSSFDRSARYLELLDAYRAEDLRTLQQACHPDVELAMAGRSRYAGRYRGVGAVMAFVAQATGWLHPSAVELEDTADDPELRVTFLAEGARSGGGPISLRFFQAVRFDDQGLVSRVLLQAEDERALGAFLERQGERPIG